MGLTLALASDLASVYYGIKFIQKLELCAFALKGEHNVYSLVPNIAVCMYIYIDQK